MELGHRQTGATDHHPAGRLEDRLGARVRERHHGPGPGDPHPAGCGLEFDSQIGRAAQFATQRLVRRAHRAGEGTRPGDIDDRPRRTGDGDPVYLGHRAREIEVVADRGLPASAPTAGSMTGGGDPPGVHLVDGQTVEDERRRMRQGGPDADALRRGPRSHLEHRLGPIGTGGEFRRERVDAVTDSVELAGAFRVLARPATIATGEEIGRGDDDWTGLICAHGQAVLP